MDDSEPNRPSTTAGVAIAILCVLMIYVLSFGPTAFLINNRYISKPYSSYVLNFYAPVIYVGWSCKPVESLTCWYLQLWHVSGYLEPE